MVDGASRARKPRRKRESDPGLNSHELVLFTEG